MSEKNCRQCIHFVWEKELENNFDDGYCGWLKGKKPVWLVEILDSASKWGAGWNLRFIETETYGARACDCYEEKNECLK